MTPEDIQAIFTMQPENAIVYLKQKRVGVSWDWQDMLDDAHATAFTVAKTTGMDVAHDIYRAVLKAAQTGQTLNDFQAALKPILQAKGWWGRQEVPNPDTGEIQSVQLGSPHRLKTIYLTNLQSAYMAGRYAEMTAATDTHPYWQYIAINDSRTREAHRKLHGSVYAADDPVWNILYPPLDYRCRIRPLSPSNAPGNAPPNGKNRLNAPAKSSQNETNCWKADSVKTATDYAMPHAGMNTATKPKATDGCGKTKPPITTLPITATWQTI